MPSPLVPMQYRSPDPSTAYQRPLITFDAPCVCGAVVPWTATPADGAVPHCGDCGPAEAA